MSTTKKRPVTRPAATSAKIAPTASQSTPATARHAVLPEIAGIVREEGDALAATIATAQAVANAAANAARSVVAEAAARRTAAMRPILRQLGYDDETVTITGIEGSGANTVLVVAPIPTSESPNV